jgi:hypothetical protein
VSAAPHDSAPACPGPVRYQHIQDAEPARLCTAPEGAPRCADCPKAEDSRPVYLIDEVRALRLAVERFEARSAQIAALLAKWDAAGIPASRYEV